MINGKNFIEFLEEDGKGDYSWDELAIEYGYRSGEAARSVWKRHRAIDYGPSTEAVITVGDVEDAVESYFNREKGEGKVTFTSSEEALSDEEIYKQCKIDQTKYVMTQLWQKSRQNGFTYSACFKLIPNNAPEKVEEAFKNVLENYKSNHLPFEAKDLIINSRFNTPSCCFIALTDVHLDKQTVDGQTIQYKVNQYHRVLDALIYKAYIANKIEEIVFTIGHDLFNTDTYFNTTTNGTQQSNNVEWDESYEIVFDSQVKAIQKLKQFCNTLHIKYIPSNHARTKEYFLVHALAIYFKHDNSIVFDRTAESTKVHIFGENFIGIHHGDTKVAGLPLYFAQKYYKEWGMAKYKSVFVGDKHSRKSWNTGDTEMDGVRVYQTPHMGGYGQWDKKQLYDNGIQSGIAVLFTQDRGRSMEIEEIL